MALRVLELFSGIGGWRYALGTRGEVLAAYDISPAANATYTLNHGTAPRARELATVPSAELAGLGADTWLMSPPCQPFCRMGAHRDLEDRRSRAFLRLVDLLREAPPRHLVLENVVGFSGSDAHALLTEGLRGQGFRWTELQLCPSRFGLPNQRPRVFIVASRGNLRTPEPPDLEAGTVGDFLDAVEDPALYLDEDTLARHWLGLDLVRAEDHRTACFIGGYGRRLVGSGSFLRTPRGTRRFSAAEVARLLGLPAGFRFPEGVSPEARYKLLGNSLSIPVAAWALSHLDG